MKAVANFRGLTTRLRQNFPRQRFVRLARESGWIVAGQAVAVIGSLIGVRLLSQLLPPGQYGELALGLTIASFINLVAFGPLNNGVARFFAAAREEGELSSYIKAITTLVGGAALVVVIVGGFCGAGLWFAGDTNTLPLGATAFAFGLIFSFNILLEVVQTFARERSAVALHKVAAEWGRFAFAAVLIVVFGPHGAMALLGYALALTAVVLSQALFIRRLVGRLPGSALPAPAAIRKWRNRILHYSWPFAIWSLFGWVQATSDRWALARFTSVEELGRYSVLFQLSYYPVVLLAGMMSQLLMPIVFNRAGSATEAGRLKSANRVGAYLSLAILGLTVMCALGALLLHDVVFHIVAAPAYRSAAAYMPLLVVAAGLMAAAQARSFDLSAAMNTRAMIAPNIVTALLGAGLNVVGATSYGMLGVILANVATSALYLAWMDVLARRQGRLRQPQRPEGG